MTGILVLARHGQSEGNRNNVFTGRDDPPLTNEGRLEARFIAYQIQQARIKPDGIYTSAMKRTRETAEFVVAELGSPMSIVSDPALNERDYGQLTGMNKDQAAAEFGPGQLLSWRRSYRAHPPGGESLADTRKRVVAYFDREIAPRLRTGENIAIIGHGNCLRALAMELEEMSPLEIETFEIATGQLLVYKIVIAEMGLKAVALGARTPSNKSMA